jgi:hypothetical protein
MTKQSRRDFLATGAALWATALIPVVVRAEPSAPILQETDGIAIALGYKKDATTVDTVKYPKRAGAAGASQFCSNCRLYSAKTEGLGGCSAIPNKLVAGPGWCNAWIPTV